MEILNTTYFYLSLIFKEINSEKIDIDIDSYDWPNSFVCSNIFSWTSFLALDNNLCDPNPCSHGTCIIDMYGLKCNCLDGYVGRKCDISKFYSYTFGIILY
jgi:hypothetical protein